MSEKSRIFIAINFSDEVIKEIARVQESLGKWKFTGKMTELENLHLNFKFLGEMDDKSIKSIKENLKKIEFKSFEAKTGSIGIFTLFSNPKTVWLKIGGEKTFELQAKIDESLKEIIKPEKKFVPHCTIARIKYVENKKGFVNYLDSIHVKPLKFRVNSFYLFKSELRKNGPIYSVIEEYSLNN